MFHVYDSDANGFLDKAEIESIIEQMMNVARYQQWDTSDLEPVSPTTFSGAPEIRAVCTFRSPANVVGVRE